MSISRVLPSIAFGVVTISAMGLGGEANCLWAQSGYRGPYQSYRDPSNFVGPLREGPNFNRPVRFGQPPQHFQPAYPRYDAAFDEALQRQERLWYLQERSRYQFENDRMLPDPNYLRPGTRPHSLFRR